MADDIDIEEHDVLDDPRIRRMLRELGAAIKVEREDYCDEQEEEGIAMDVEDHLHPRDDMTVPIVFEDDNDLLKTFNNKIILGSKPSTSLPAQHATETLSDKIKYLETDLYETEKDQEENADNQDTDEPDSDNQHSDNDQETDIGETNILKTLLQEGEVRNRIIIGDKISTDNWEKNTEEMEQLPDVSLVLEDCRSFLDNNPCYCKQCKVLFATDHALHAHYALAHSFLVAVGRNKAVKSTAKSSLPGAGPGPRGVTCSHCDRVFPNKIELLTHRYELLPGTFPCERCHLAFDSEAARRAHRAAHAPAPAASYVTCRICSCHFKWTAKLRAHMRALHGAADAGGGPRGLPAFNCGLCNHKMSNSKKYNLHIQVVHSNLYHMSVANFEKISKFKCPQCELAFSSDYSRRIHLAAKHGGARNADEPASPSKGRAVAKAPAIAQSQKTLRTHSLPQSTVFKCNSCCVHFTSCSTAVLHSRVCVSQKGDFKCHRCRLTFKWHDKLHHEQQHRVCDAFRVVELAADTLERLLCKCRTCKVCFDEGGLAAHGARRCRGDTPAVACRPCGERVHASAAARHREAHAHGLIAQDFIVVDYVNFKMSVKGQDAPRAANKAKQTKQYKLKQKVRVKTGKLVKLKVLPNQVMRADERAYFYCPTCKCYMRINRRTHKHCIGQCNTQLPTTTCKSCGLRFTLKSLLCHKRLHAKLPKIKLKDLKFVDIQTNQTIDPPFPDFDSCKICKVTFFSAVALNNHSCNAEKPRLCGYCNQQFSDLAYNLHLPFHEYGARSAAADTDDASEANENIPEIMKKYESLEQVWNILFLCQACDVATDEYDSAVRHCQDHFCNMQSYNVTIRHCKICRLSFVDDCFQRHERLHLSDGIDRDSFKILEYKYETLLSDGWLDMFSSLTKEQIDLVLSKSMYTYTRRVRMAVAVDGPTDTTLYRCGRCAAVVPPARVAQHSLSNACAGGRVYDCAKCKLKFTCKSHRTVHENLHNGWKLDERSFRIVQFHADERFRVAGLQQSEAGELGGEERKEPGGLKFIRCQPCGKLINKQKYKSHLQLHHQHTKGKAKPNAAQHPHYVHNFYKCKACGLCVSKKNIKTHVCESGHARKSCTKCSLQFRSQNLASHHKYHARYKINRSNINVMYFENGVILKSNGKALKRLQSSNANRQLSGKELTYYQCAKCTICVWNKANVTNHACSPERSRFACELCGVRCLSSRRRAHLALHELRQFDHRHVRLIAFNEDAPPKGDPAGATARKRKPPHRYYEEEETVAKKPRANQSSDKTAELDAEAHESERDDDQNETLGSDREEVTYEDALKEYPYEINNRYYKCKACKLLFVTCTSLIEHEGACAGERDASACAACGLWFHSKAIDDHHDMQKCSTSMDKNVYILTVARLGKCPNVPRNWVFRCAPCGTHNVTYRGMQYHLSNNHVHAYSIKTCRPCKLQFSSRSYKSHLETHHAKGKSSASSLSIAVVADMSLRAARSALAGDAVSEHSRPQPSADVSTSSCKSKETDAAEDARSIYTCGVCGLNFVHPRSLQRHTFVNKHNENQHSCPVCGLKFTNISLKKHMSLHHNEARGAPEDANGDGDSALTENTNDASSVDSPEARSSERSGAAPTAPADGGATRRNRLYKCGRCDVYYLTADECCEHALQHAPLDVTEYIACKICELQFCCEYLGRHMKSHREETFRIEELTVVEYRLSDAGELVVDTYRAADRPGAKLVSTTTHFDADCDGKGVCVDSTTENVL